MMKRNALISVGVLLSVLGIVFMYALMSKIEHRRSLSLPEYFDIPEFSLASTTGNRFGSEDMAGKVSVLDFIFTTCMGPCPVMGTKMKLLYEEFAQEPTVQLVSISVDPVRDTLPVLEDYAERFGVTDNRWAFLREDNMERVAGIIENGFKLAADDLPFSHPVQLILIDPKGKIRGYYDGTLDADVDSLTAHIHHLLDN